MAPALRILALLGLTLLAAGCGYPPGTDAGDVEIAREAHVHDGPTEMTLYTVVNVRTGGGAHTGLMINGDERVIFDPAGSFRHPEIVERGDMVYGVTEALRKTYIDYHVRPAYYMVAQTVAIDDATAARVIALAEENGAAQRAFCARATSRVLREAGFDTIDRTFYPGALMEDMAAIPGVETRTITVENVERDHPTYFTDAEPDYPV